MADSAQNPWKMTIGIGVAVGMAVVTGVVVANWTSLEPALEAPAPATTPASVLPVVATSPVTPAPATGASTAVAPSPVAALAAPEPSSVPTQLAIDACNQQAAAAQTNQTSKTREVVKDRANAAAVGGIGAGSGALYGVNENRKNDEPYRTVYASCLRARGYTS